MKGETKISTRGGDSRTVKAWSTATPGLAVVPMIWDDGSVTDGWYRLSHEASGMTVGPYAWPSLAAARRCAAALADILDWTEDIDDLNDDDRLPAIKATCKTEGVHEWDASLRLDAFRSFEEGE